MSSPAPGRDDLPASTGRAVSRGVRRRDRTPPLTPVRDSGAPDVSRPDADLQERGGQATGGEPEDAPAGQRDPRSPADGDPPVDDPLDPAPGDVAVDDAGPRDDVAVEDGQVEDAPVEDAPIEDAAAEEEVDDWDEDEDEVVFRRRPLWVTLPLHLVLVAIIGLDTWAAFAWSGGAGQLGATLAAICASVSLIFLVFLVTDARRHWPNAHNGR